MLIRKDRETATTLEEALRKYEYDPISGLFHWRIDNPPARKGSLAGNCSESFSYVRLKLFNIYHSAHRVAWAMTHGTWPDGLIDHINGNTKDNRIENLRIVDHTGNKRNVKLHKDNTSGFCGVYWIKAEQRWGCSIKVDYELLHLGYYDDLVSAVIARIHANWKYAFHENHGRR